MNYNRNIAVYFKPNEIMRLGASFNNNKHGTLISFYAL